MRVSYQMEQYAQRAVNKRRNEVDPNRKIGNFLMTKFLNEGKYLEEALTKLGYFERQEYIETHSEMILSSDGVEGINVVWCQNSQVLTHRLISPELRAENGGSHYLNTWVRRVGPQQKDALRAHIRARLQKRVLDREDGRIQFALNFDEVEGQPQFLQAKG